MAHLETYGCKAFTLIKNIPKLQRLEPRAHIGYLIGWDSTNVFRIWVPSKREVIQSRDVKFSKGVYNPKDLDIGAILEDEVNEDNKVLDVLEDSETNEDEDIVLNDFNIPSMAENNHNSAPNLSIRVPSLKQFNINDYPIGNDDLEDPESPSTPSNDGNLFSESPMLSNMSHNHPNHEHTSGTLDNHNTISRTKNPPEHIIAVNDHIEASEGGINPNGL